MEKLMSCENSTLYDFISHIINFNSVDDILNECKNKSDKGFIFERLWDIIIKSNCCSKFNSLDFNFSHIIGNVNNAGIKKMISLDDYFNNKIRSGKSSGCSDITLYSCILLMAGEFHHF